MGTFVGDHLFGAISLGDMTMYLLVFKQGQGALSTALGSVGGMYEDNLYLSNLYEFLAHPSTTQSGSATSSRVGGCNGGGRCGGAGIVDAGHRGEGVGVAVGSRRAVCWGRRRDAREVCRQIVQ